MHSCFERYLFWSFARRALVRRRTPMIWRLSNARSGDLYILAPRLLRIRALVREIIPNTIPSHIHTHIHTYMT